jgi:hypothetical protein
MARIEDTGTLAFIKSCVQRRRIRWTYHVNMRLNERRLSREMILDAVDTFEIIEIYAKDKYLPSYLVYAEHKGESLHIVIAPDNEDDTITIITSYRPDAEEWEAGFKARRKR